MRSFRVGALTDFDVPVGAFPGSTQGRESHAQ